MSVFSKIEMCQCAYVVLFLISCAKFLCPLKPDYLMLSKWCVWSILSHHQMEWAIVTSPIYRTRSIARPPCNGLVAGKSRDGGHVLFLVIWFSAFSLYYQKIQNARPLLHGPLAVIDIHVI
jgi:hypothetical protein